MKLGLIAGNKALPLLFSQLAKKNKPELEIIALCFKGETHPSLPGMVDRAYWVHVGEFKKALEILKKEEIKECVMVGQITPRRIFRCAQWDKGLIELVNTTDYRPHSIFLKIIDYLENYGLRFLNSTLYMQELLAKRELMNHISLDSRARDDISFGIDLITKFVELDVGQTVVVKNKAAVALEALEGTDNTIRRGAKIAGRGCTVLKFSKKDQDLRFDVPVVGGDTLFLLHKIGARALVVEAERVIILDKEKFLKQADKWGIAIVGEQRKIKH